MIQAMRGQALWQLQKQRELLSHVEASHISQDLGMLAGMHSAPAFSDVRNGVSGRAHEARVSHKQHPRHKP